MGDRGVVFVTTSAQSQRPMAVRRAELDALFREARQGRQVGRSRQVDVGLPHAHGVPVRQPGDGRGRRVRQTGLAATRSRSCRCRGTRRAAGGSSTTRPGGATRTPRASRAGCRTGSPASTRYSALANVAVLVAERLHRPTERPEGVRAEPGQPGPHPRRDEDQRRADRGRVHRQDRGRERRSRRRRCRVCRRTRRWAAGARCT